MIDDFLRWETKARPKTVNTPKEKDVAKWLLFLFRHYVGAYFALPSARKALWIKYNTTYVVIRGSKLAEHRQVAWLTENLDNW